MACASKISLLLSLLMHIVHHYLGNIRKAVPFHSTEARYQCATNAPPISFLAFRIRKEAGMEDGFWLGL